MVEMVSAGRMYSVVFMKVSGMPGLLAVLGGLILNGAERLSRQTIAGMAAGAGGVSVKRK